MPAIAPWLQPTDFIGAMKSGADIGLSEAQMQQQAEQHAAELALRRDELSARMSEEQAQRQQTQGQENAASALRAAALKQAGILGTGRLANEVDRTQGLLDTADTRNNLMQSKMDAQQQQFGETLKQKQAAIDKKNMDDFLNRENAFYNRNKATPSKPDALRQRLAVDFLLKKAGQNPPENTLEDELSQYDKNFPSSPAETLRPYEPAFDSPLPPPSDGTPDFKPVASPMGTSGNAPAAADSLTPPASDPLLQDDTLVSVINPSGKRVRISKSQLDDALSQGYKQP